MEKYGEEKSLNVDAPFFSSSELHEIHENVKEESLAQFQKQPKLGDDEVVKPFEDKLIQRIKAKYESFKHENERNRIIFQVK